MRTEGLSHKMNSKNSKFVITVAGFMLSQACSTAAPRSPASTSDGAGSQNSCIPFVYSGSANGAVPSTKWLVCEQTDKVQVTVWSRDGSFNANDSKAQFELLLNQSNIAYSKPNYSSNAFTQPIYIMSKSDFQSLLPSFGSLKNFPGNLNDYIHVSTLYLNGSFTVLDTGSIICEYSGSTSALRVAQIGEQKYAVASSLNASDANVKVSWQMMGGNSSFSGLAKLSADPEVVSCSVSFSHVAMPR